MQPPPSPRRHDLDALRAIAMLLGIVLHAMLSFMPGIWPVQDTRQSGLYYLLFSAIHGFRMPLFFLLSGFFTAMLWRRRGLAALLRHRAGRILLPLVLGTFTIVPAVTIISLLAMRHGANEGKAPASEFMDVSAPADAARSRVEALFRAHASADVTGTEVGAPRDSTRSGSTRGNALRTTLTTLTVLPIFHHLWFLWFLCWFVAAFAIAVKAAQWLNVNPIPSSWALAPACWLWLLPLTMIPQWFMGRTITVFGPDISFGLIPIPHVLAYYAIFFGFGALYFEARDVAGRLGAWWRGTLPVILLVVFPLGLVFTHDQIGVREWLLPPGWHRLVAGLLQVTYAWAMSFALMGLCRTLLWRERPGVRYMSDAAYWLYLTHVPLVIAAQWAIRSWSLPSFVKCLLLCVMVGGFLLFTYHFLVRYTWIGSILNGPRTRTESRQPGFLNTR